MSAAPDPGLCASCKHSKVITNRRGSAFYYCQLSETKPEFRKYPVLPVRTCSGFTPSAIRSQLSADPGAPDD